MKLLPTARTRTSELIRNGNVPGTPGACPASSLFFPARGSQRPDDQGHFPLFFAGTPESGTFASVGSCHVHFSSSELLPDAAFATRNRRELARPATAGRGSRFHPRCGGPGQCHFARTRTRALTRARVSHTPPSRTTTLKGTWTLRDKAAGFQSGRARSRPSCQDGQRAPRVVHLRGHFGRPDLTVPPFRWARVSLRFESHSPSYL